MAILIVHQIEWETIFMNQFIKRVISIPQLLFLRIGLDVTAGITYGGIKEKIIQMKKTLKMKKEKKQKSLTEGKI